MINSNSSTKTHLKMSGMFIRYPYVLLTKLIWLPRYIWLHRGVSLLLILTVVVFVVLVKLGLWQMDRAVKKTELLAQMEARQSAATLNPEQLIAELAKGSVTGYRLQVQAKPANPQIWLLDNQVYQGQVGYLAFQLLQITSANQASNAEQPWLLLELGFIAAKSHRDALPEVSPIVGELALTGRLYQKQINPLSHHLLAEPFTTEQGERIRFQNLNLPEMAQMLGHPILPAVLQPDVLPQLQPAQTLPHPWQPFPLSAEKHWGYALQWFAMATVFAGLMGWQAMKYLKKSRQRHQADKEATKTE
ncbi:SURF1 family protein [Shewanella xiamenensis]|uniref:SURF1 family protein n=1 Tax=Shewanella xiamenensis TaxID=332186 RepID=UPI0035BB7951